MNRLVIATILTLTGCLSSVTVYSQARVHPSFGALTEAQVREEFEEYEEKGKRCAQNEARGRSCAPISFSQEQPLNIPVQGMRGVEWVTFRVSISAPRSRVRELGYEFGKVARQRTPADRQDVLRRLTTRMSQTPKTIDFVFKLISPPDAGASLPELGFALVNENRRKLWSASQPDFGCPDRDPICQVALQESGQTVSFPFFVPPDDLPFVDDLMRSLRLMVIVNDEEEPIDFELSSLH